MVTWVPVAFLLAQCIFAHSSLTSGISRVFPFASFQIKNKWTLRKPFTSMESSSCVFAEPRETSMFTSTGWAELFKCWHPECLPIESRTHSSEQYFFLDSWIHSHQNKKRGVLWMPLRWILKKGQIYSSFVFSNSIFYIYLVFLFSVYYCRVFKSQYIAPWGNCIQIMGVP